MKNNKDHRKEFPFQYYTISNVSLLEQNGFNFDDYSFNRNNRNELYIGNINGLVCRHDMGYPLRLYKYLKVDPADMIKRKVTFLLPENYLEIIDGKQGFRKYVLDVLDCPALKDQITVLTYKVDNSDIINKIEELKTMPKFDTIISNPPYAIGNKIISSVIEHLSDNGNAVVIQPLNQYKNKNLFEHIKYFELADAKAFTDAVITENLNISIVTKGKQNKYNWQELVLESCDQNFRKFYDWNITNNRNVVMQRKDSKSNVPLLGINIDTDFVESGRCFAAAGGAGFGPEGYGYKWNVTKQNTNTDWLHCAGIIYFDTKHKKDNFAKFWYSNSKGKSLISRAALGLHMVSVSADYYFFIPQIDWETIDQHPLWNTDADAAVLDTMDLKWNDDKTKIIEK